MLKRMMLASAFTLCVPAAHATVIFSGGSFGINGTVNDNIFLENNSHLTIGTGGVVRGTDDSSLPSWADGAIRTSNSNSNSITIEGSGRVIAGSDQHALNLGNMGSVVRIKDNAFIDGNIFNDQVSPGWQNESRSLHRLYLSDNARVDGNVTFPGYVQMSGNSVITGNVNALINSNVNFNIDGGTVEGFIQLAGYDDHIVNVNGGSILGGLRSGVALIDLNMTGGYIGGAGISGSGTLLDAVISGGRIDGGLSIIAGDYGPSHIRFTGGQIDADTSDWLVSLSGSTRSPGYSSLEITGGQFGYSEAGLGLFLDYGVNFDIFGWGLHYNDGLLSGYLSDGNWFSNALNFGSNWRGEFRIHDVQVPEPGTATLLLIGLAAMSRRFLRRRPAG
jgi:hypothetical protein